MSSYAGAPYAGSAYAGAATTPASTPTGTTARGVLTVEISFDGDPYDPPTWVDVTADVDGDHPLEIERGRRTELDDLEAGRCTFRLRNHDRKYDPLNTTGPYYGKLKPRRKVRVSMTVGVNTFTMFTGYILRWPQRYDAARRTTWVNIRALDLLGLIAPSDWSSPDPFTLDDTDLSELDSDYRLADDKPQFAQLRTGDRIREAMDIIGVPATLVDVDAGLSVCAAGVPEADVIGEELETIDRTEQGFVFVSAAGLLTFVERHGWAARTQMAETQLTLSDDQSTATTGPYTGLVWDGEDDRQIINEITFRLPNGSTVSANSSSSRREYGPRSKTWSTHHVDALDAEVLAEWLIDRFGQAVVRIEEVTIDPQARPGVLWPAVCGIDLGAQVRVVHQPQGTGPVIDQTCRVLGIKHRYHDLGLVTSWQLAQVDPTVYWMLDDAAASEIDSIYELAP